MNIVKGLHTPKFSALCEYRRMFPNSTSGCLVCGGSPLVLPYLLLICIDELQGTNRHLQHFRVHSCLDVHMQRSSLSCLSFFALTLRR